MNEFGQIVLEEWEKSALIRTEIELGDFVIMPNHFHAIVIIVCRGELPVAPTAELKLDDRTGIRPGDRSIYCSGDLPVAPTTELKLGVRLDVDAPTGPMPKSIGALMAGFKSATTKRINISRKTPGIPVWQRNYWDHIIRDDRSYQLISQYIQSNPLKWEDDRLFYVKNN